MIKSKEPSRTRRDFKALLTCYLNPLSGKSQFRWRNDEVRRINDLYLFEVGGKNKKKDQIAGEDNAFLAIDDIVYGKGNKIPLWLFGFLY